MIHFIVEIGIMRNYVYENALCSVATDFYARLCKFRRVALPVDNDDDVNERFVQQNMQILNNGQYEIEKNITSLQTNRQFMLKYGWHPFGHANIDHSPD